jgi:hypothetical protein
MQRIRNKAAKKPVARRTGKKKPGLLHNGINNFGFYYTPRRIYAERVIEF